MILVTGGTGLVGAHLLFALCQKESKIRATYRSEGKIRRVEHLFSYYTDTPSLFLERIEWVQADVNDIPALEKAFVSITKVYHIAALVSFDSKDDKKLLKTNVEGTTNIVNLCLGYMVKKLCFASSIAALGPSVGQKPITEENEGVDGSTTYAISKYLAEMEVWRASQEGLAVVIVNPGIIVAPGFWKSSSGSFFYQAYKAPRYHLPHGTGFVGINDVVNAMTHLMEADVKNERYILVNQNWTYRQFAELLAKGLKKPIPKKEIKPWMLEALWRLDWLRANLFGKRRLLTKMLAQQLKFRDNYDNTKIKGSLGFEFEDLEGSTQKYCAIFLSEQALS